LKNITPLKIFNACAIVVIPKSNPLKKDMSHDVQIITISPPNFCTALPFT